MASAIHLLQFGLGAWRLGMKNEKNDVKSNVIDLSERKNNVKGPAQKLSANLKMRLDLEQMKVAVSTSLLSLVALVTLANTNIFSTSSEDTVASHTRMSRGIASIPTGTTDAEDALVERLAKKDLSESAVIGRRPSSIERLSLEVLEGKYSVLLAHGKIQELAFLSGGPEAGDRPKHINDLPGFFEGHRDLLPVDFEKTVKLGSAHEGLDVVETYGLLDKESATLAKVLVRLDSAGRLLSMRVAPIQVASK